MNKILIIALIGLALVSAQVCDNSCNCSIDDQPTFCTSCTIAQDAMYPDNSGCASCDAGYHVDPTNVYSCIAVISHGLTPPKKNCHASCNCPANSNVCTSCKDTSSSIDSLQRSCPCPSGKYTSSLFPYVCSSVVSTGPGLTMDACHLDIGLKTKDILINTNCHFAVVDTKSWVFSEVSLNFTPISMSDECKQAYRTLVQYKNPATGLYVDLPAKYLTEGPLGAKTVGIPLIEVYDLAESTTVNASNQISQVVHLQIKIGHSDKFVRIHKWDLFVYTNRDQVQVFNLDVDVQRTNGCQPGQECIVIADLNTYSFICENNSCNSTRGNAPYAVGDMFYAKISFTDPTYTKRLTFVSLYFKNDIGVIFNFSQLTQSSWDGTGLVLAMPLVEPSMQAAIQVNMLIEATTRMRSLQSAPQTSQSSFKATVTTVPTTKQVQQVQSNNSFTLLFCLANFAALLLAF